MKLLLLSLFISLPSLTTPKVGDSVKYHVAVTVDGEVQFDGIEEKKILAYDATKEAFLIEATNSGEFDENTYRVTPYAKVWVPKNKIFTAKYIGLYLEQCGTGNAGTRIQSKIKTSTRGEVVVEACQESLDG